MSVNGESDDHEDAEAEADLTQALSKLVVTPGNLETKSHGNQEDIAQDEENVGTAENSEQEVEHILHGPLITKIIVIMTFLKKNSLSKENTDADNAEENSWY